LREARVVLDEENFDRARGRICHWISRPRPFGPVVWFTLLQTAAAGQYVWMICKKSESLTGFLK
jgi:hypothetical protein